MGRIGDFDKDYNFQGWFDETLANAPRGWFDKSDINGQNSDTQTAQGAPAAKTTRAHDRPLEWWLEVEKASWAAATAATTPSSKTPANDAGSDWYAAFKSKREETQKPNRVNRVPMLPLDAKSNVITLVPREEMHDAESNWGQRDAMLRYLEKSSLERAAGTDISRETYTNVTRPLLFAATGALIVFGLQHAAKAKKSKQKMSRAKTPRVGKLLAPR